MLRKIILGVALVGVLVWTVTCGRSRSTPSDTPVPTLTPLPAIAATATTVPTAEPTQAPTASPTTEEPTVAAVAPSSAITTSEGMASTEPLTETEQLTETVSVTASVPVTTSETVTGAATVGESEAITESTTETETEEATATAEPSATIQPTATSEATAIGESEVVTEAAATESETEEATATAEPSATARATATTRPTATSDAAALGESEAVTDSQAASEAETATATATSEPSATARPTATTEEVTRSEVLTEAVTVGEAETEAEAATATETVEATATAKPTATSQPTATPRPSATATSAPTETSTVPVEATEEVTEEPTSTAQPSATVTAIAETTEVAEATATPTSEIGVSSEISVTGEVTETDELTPGVETTTGSAEAVERQTIALPTDLPTSVQIVDGQFLSELIPEVDPSVAELSPDGSRVAWLVPEEARRLATLCIAEIPDGGQNCFTAEDYRGLPYRLAWSPDGEWLAFSEDSAAQALESDIWLFNVENGEVTNRTDDQASGRYAEVEGDYALDYLPMWDPATGLVYFWRSSPDGDGGFDLNLMRLDPNTEADPVVVRTLGKSLGDGLVRFGWQRFYLQGPSAIAPDGSQLAVAIVPAQEMDLSASKALWLIDLVDESVEPSQLVNALAWQTALPQWSSQPAVARGLQWTADGKGIVVAALSSDLRLPLLLTYYVEASSGDVTPLVDFSSSRDRAAFFRMDAAGNAMRMLVPWTIALAPNANVVLLVTDVGGAVRVLGAPLPPEEDSMAVLYEHLSPGYEVWTRSSSGSNGDVLVYGLLLVSVPQE